MFYVYHEENDVSELEHILIRDNSVKGYMRDISKDSKHFYTEDEITAIEKAVRKLRFYPTDIVETNDLGRPSSTILFKYKDGRRRTIDTYENYSIMAFSTGALGLSLIHISMCIRDRAGAVVTKDVAENTVVGGVPAKIIRKIEE